jgi:hypothetical protein
MTLPIRTGPLSDRKDIFSSFQLFSLLFTLRFSAIVKVSLPYFPYRQVSQTLKNSLLPRGGQKALVCLDQFFKKIETAPEIELGKYIIEQENRPYTVQFLKNMRLSQPETDYRSPLLPLGAIILERAPFHHERQIISLGPAHGHPAGALKNTVFPHFLCKNTLRLLHIEFL